MYRLRFLILMIRCLFRNPLPLLSEFTLHFRAWPFLDTDATRLFSHAYSATMALSRWHLVFGSEFRVLALRHAWAPVSTAETIQFCKSIRWLQRFRIVTRILYWNDRRFYIEHRFMVGEQLMARVLVEGLLRGPTGVLKPNEAFGFLEQKPSSPALTSELDGWVRWLETRDRK